MNLKALIVGALFVLATPALAGQPYPTSAEHCKIPISVFYEVAEEKNYPRPFRDLTIDIELLRGYLVKVAGATNLETAVYIYRTTGEKLVVAFVDRDNCVLGISTTANTKMLENFRKAPV